MESAYNYGQNVEHSVIFKPVQLFEINTAALRY